MSAERRLESGAVALATRTAPPVQSFPNAGSWDRSTTPVGSVTPFTYLLSMRVGCLLFLLPFVEVALLIQVGRWIGAWEVVGWVMGMVVLGIVIARWQGARAMAGIRSEVARGGVPSHSVVDSVSIHFGCLCLAVPGFLTDIAGFLLLLPFSRRHLYCWIQGAILASATKGGVRIVTWGRGRSRPSSGDSDPPPRPGEIIQ
jgi:UPF0716 protein FxsA